MKQIFIITAFLVLQLSTFAQQKKEILSKDLQIKLALQAAPTDQREEATVYGYDENGKFVTLREGTNNLICQAPDVNQALLYVYAYHKSLDAFMARGRELIAEGKRRQRNEIREAEFKAGKLIIPQTPTMLYGYWGSLDNLDKETGEIKDAKRRYVLYMPYATADSIGLSDKPTLPGIPWLMDAGTYKAHIMINPPDMGHSH